jgi:hypothetical protein
MSGSGRRICWPLSLVCQAGSFPGLAAWRPAALLVPAVRSQEGGGGSLGLVARGVGATREALAALLG